MAHATVTRCLKRRGMSRMPQGAARGRSGALSGPAPATCCRWTPSAWRASRGPGTRSPATASAPAPRSASGSAGSSATRSSTTTPGCVYTEIHRRRAGRRPSPPSSSAPSRSSPATASAPSGCRPTTPGPTSTTAPCASCSTDRGIQHRRIPPRTPKRNGKVERYQQTLAREWAYGQRYRSSRRPSRSAATLARPLQHHPQPQLPRQPAAHQPRSERPEAQQLVGRPETSHPKPGAKTTLQSGIRAVEPVKRFWPTH